MSDVVTPGVGRIIQVTVNGMLFGFRRPSVADEADITRRFASKLVVSGLASETDVTNQYYGNNLMWQARMEICLVPRKNRRLEPVALGEMAPAHWMDAGEIDLSNVMPDEFNEVCEALDPLVYPKKKKVSPPANSTESAPAPETA